LKTLLTVLGVLLALLALLALLRLRLRLEYGEGGPALAVSLGPLPLLRLPAPRREKGSPGQKKIKRKKKEAPEGKKTKGGSVPGFQDLLSIIGDVLGKLKRRLSIDELTLRFQSAAPDPADAALLFGASGAGAAGLVQVLEALFRVRKTDVRTAVSFTETKPKVYALVRLSVPLGALLWLGLRALRLYRRARKHRSPKVTEE